jgi:hypothetical protein
VSNDNPGGVFRLEALAESLKHPEIKSAGMRPQRTASVVKNLE